MTVVKEFGKFIVTFINAIRDENIRWQRENMPYLNELERQRKLSKLDIEQELKRRQIRFENEIEQLAIEGRTEIQDFREFLVAIDKIKNDIRINFQQASLPVVLLIHQYGKQLLVKMWHSANLNDRKKYEQQLFDFLYTINEDIYLVSSKKDRKGFSLPEKTIKLIRSSDGDAENSEGS